jgi:hypothetical protein
MAVCVAVGCKGKPKQNETLRSKCKKSSANAEDVNYDNLIINEVLWYADQHRHAATKDGIIKVLTCHFSLDDVNTAKAMLLSKCGDYINPERKKNRKDSPNRTEKMKVCEDIVDAFFDIDDHIDLTCVALKWTKTIKVAPEEVPDLFLAEKVVALESKFKLYEDSLSELKARQLLLEEQQGKPLMSQVVAGGPRPPQSATVSSPGGRSTPNRKGSLQINQMRQREMQGGRNTPGGRRGSQADSVPARLSQPNVGNSGQGDQGGGFVFPSDQRRRMMRYDSNTQRQQPDAKSHERPHNARHTVVGQSNDATGLRATPMPSRDFFIYRVHKDDGAKELTDYLSKNGVTVRVLNIKSHDEAKYNSFKLSVSTDDAVKVNDPQFWPSGIYVRRWHDDRQRNNPQDEQPGVTVNNNMDNLYGASRGTNDSDQASEEEKQE